MEKDNATIAEAFVQYNTKGWAKSLQPIYLPLILVPGTVVHQFLLRPSSFSQYCLQVSLRDPQPIAVKSNNG
jgi:hypothetical protein